MEICETQTSNSEGIAITNVGVEATKLCVAGKDFDTCDGDLAIGCSLECSIQKTEDIKDQDDSKVLEACQRIGEVTITSVLKGATILVSCETDCSEDDREIIKNYLKYERGFKTAIVPPKYDPKEFDKVEESPKVNANVREHIKVGVIETYPIDRDFDESLMIKTFDSFLPLGVKGDDALIEEDVATARAVAESAKPQLFRIDGPDHSGKTHIAKAMCAARHEKFPEENLLWVNGQQLKDWYSKSAWKKSDMFEDVQALRAYLDEFGTIFIDDSYAITNTAQKTLQFITSYIKDVKGDKLIVVTGSEGTKLGHEIRLGCGRSMDIEIPEDPDDKIKRHTGIILHRLRTIIPEDMWENESTLLKASLKRHFDMRIGTLVKGDDYMNYDAIIQEMSDKLLKTSGCVGQMQIAFEGIEDVGIKKGVHPDRVLKRALKNHGIK